MRHILGYVNIVNIKWRMNSSQTAFLHVKCKIVHKLTLYPNKNNPFNSSLEKNNNNEHNE